MSNNFECRICYDEEKNEKKLIRPCACDGTNRYVHRKCLNTWRNYDQNEERAIKCMECKKKYIFIFQHPKEEYDIHIFSLSNESSIHLFILFETFVFLSSILFNIIDSTYGNDAMLFYLHLQDIYQLDDIFTLSNDIISEYGYYFGLITLIDTIIFHTVSTFIMYHNVHRKKKYLTLTIIPHIIKVFGSMQFLWITYLTQDIDSCFFILFSSFFSFFNFFIFSSIFDSHNKAIKVLNEKFNTKIIKNLDKKISV